MNGVYDWFRRRLTRGLPSVAVYPEEPAPDRVARIIREDGSALEVRAGDHVHLACAGEFEGDIFDIVRRSIAPEYLGRGGIISAMQNATLDGEPVTRESFERFMQQLYDAREYRPPARTTLECGDHVPEQFAQDVSTQVARIYDVPTTLLGIPVIVDETMAPDEWRLVDEHGRVLHRYPPTDDGDILDRIDGAIELWELRPDAARWSPSDD